MTTARGKTSPPSSRKSRPMTLPISPPDKDPTWAIGVVNKEMEKATQERMKKRTGSKTPSQTKRNREQGLSFEKYLAQRLSMKTQPGSGCGIHKEDVVDSAHLMQAKSTRTEKITIRLQDLKDLKEHAIKECRDPVFAIGFSLNGTFLDSRIWLMVPIDRRRW